ncbi:MAG: PQQ-dependent sugar dehydrogenase [Acidimicrobiia bacterium]|nr:PQQ-dependent sugar dehydrogenase [Acidimicrobiia bacterium]
MRYPTTDRAAARVGAALVISALVLTGCGSSDGGEAGPTSSTVAGSTTGAPVAPAPSTTVDAVGPSTTDVVETATSIAAPDFDRVTIGLEEVSTALEPTAMATRADDDSLYVAERAGRVVRIDPADDSDPSPILDISDEVDTSVERGLLGLTFSPDGSRLYLHWSDSEGATRVTEFTEDGGRETAVIDENSRREIFALDQPFPNHNGGELRFGPDGYLYLGLGDGGAGGDPLGAGQDTDTPLGSIVRIDPSVDEDQAHGRYGIPDGNIDGTELYIIGVRNPWRFSFDRATDELWIADVGQDQWEEINRLPAGEISGTNLGWNLQEGRHDFAGGEPDDYVPPVAEYGHDTGISVTGGYVYRGSAIPDLVGTYVFGDWREAEIWAIPPFTGDVGEIRSLGVSVPQFGLVSFGQDNAGELYVLHSDGPVYRVVPA